MIPANIINDRTRVWIVRCSCGHVGRLEQKMKPQSCQSPRYSSYKRTVACGRAFASVEELANVSTPFLSEPPCAPCPPCETFPA